MKPSELAKELGFATAKALIESAAKHGIAIVGVRAEIDESAAKAIRSAVNPASKKAAPKVAPKTAKPEEAKSKPHVAKEKIIAEKPAQKIPPPVSHAPKPAPVPTPPPQPVKAAAAPVHPQPQATVPRPIPTVPPSHPPKVSHPPADAEPEKPAEKTPLIDVDKIIGVEKEIRVLAPDKFDKLDSETAAELEKKRPKVVGREHTDGHAFHLRPKFRRPMGGRPFHPPVKISPADRTIEVSVPITIKDFSQLMGIKANLILKKLIEAGSIITINSFIDGDIVQTLAGEFKREIVIRKEKTAEESLVTEGAPDRAEDLVPRAPVVTFMGHVDHGKTSLLDRIRKTNVAAGEAGGITQHIGAYKVKTVGNKYVVFLDTPGHEAFTAMRARGANVTDVAVLVVAADDGVMPQTEEAINHARAADVTIVVAINKCDKKEANANRVRHQLAQLNLIPEEWGGKSVFVEVSATTGTNVDNLLEMLSLEADLLELKANPKKPAKGAVLEAKKTENRGVVITALVQDGVLRKGDIILCGKTFGRVRHMSDELGRSLLEAPPSTPVQLIGLIDLPEAGDEFMVVKDLQGAKRVAEERQGLARERDLAERSHVTLDNLFSHIESGNLKDVRIILKTDVKGSAEVLKSSLKNIVSEEVKLRILHSGVGNINESDVLLADASDAIIIGFNVPIDERARVLAKDKGVDIRKYDVIYQIMDDVKAALEGLLEPEKVQEIVGRCRIKEVFKVSKSGKIAGGLVTEGKLERSAIIRLMRNNAVIHEGKLESLRRFKDDVREVANGLECGLRVAGFDDIQAGDIIEAYHITEISRKLESAKPSGKQ